MAEEGTLTNTANGNTYFIYGIQSYDEEETMTAASFTVPEGEPSETYITRLEGKRQTLTLSFTLVDNGVDRSDGTPGSIETVDQQIVYLRTTMYTVGTSDSWTLALGSKWAGTIEGTIERLSFSQNAGDPNHALASFDFLTGDVVS